MVARKMFPAGAVEKSLSTPYDEVKLGISFRILAGQIVMQFSDHVEWVRMTSSGTRKLAALLTEKAAELDRLGNLATRMQSVPIRRLLPPAISPLPARPPRTTLCRGRAPRAASKRSGASQLDDVFATGLCRFPRDLRVRLCDD